MSKLYMTNSDVVVGLIEPNLHMKQTNDFNLIGKDASRFMIVHGETEGDDATIIIVAERVLRTVRDYLAGWLVSDCFVTLPAEALQLE